MIALTLNDTNVNNDDVISYDDNNDNINNDDDND
jgi:hypothetical protein